jgi:hypothetical protein
MGVLSAVKERSRSLTAGEKCRGGGVSRESSFTTWMEVLGRGGGCESDERRRAEVKMSERMRVVWISWG